jgi:hypothetical protein
MYGLVPGTAFGFNGIRWGGQKCRENPFRCTARDQDNSNYANGSFHSHCVSCALLWSVCLCCTYLPTYLLTYLPTYLPTCFAAQTATYYLISRYLFPAPNRLAS